MRRTSMLVMNSVPFRRLGCHGGSAPSRYTPPPEQVAGLTVPVICLDSYIPVQLYEGMIPATVAALGEPQRVRILELLRQGPRAVGEISATLDLSQPLVSKHLRVLARTRWVCVEPVGTRRIYRLDPCAFEEVDAWLRPFRALWQERFDRLDAFLKDSDAQTPEPKTKP